MYVLLSEICVQYPLFHQYGTENSGFFFDADITLTESSLIGREKANWR